MTLEEKKQQKLNLLKKTKYFELLNRLVCYACVIPFFYTAACLGQKKEVPFKAKLGTIGFITSSFTAVAIKSKEGKIQEQIKKIQQKNQNALY